MGLPGEVRDAVVHPRIAKALSIQDGDAIKFDLRGFLEARSLPVIVMDIRAEFPGASAPRIGSSRCGIYIFCRG
jgi:hypothetical protein